MKFIIRSVILPFVLLFSLILGGCSSTSEVKDENLNTINEDGPKSNKEIIPINIYFPNGAVPANYEAVADEIATRLGIRPNFITFQYDRFGQRAERMFDTTEGLDAIYCIQEIQSLTDADKIMDLTESLSKYAPGFYKSLSENELKAVTYKGKIMAIPHGSAPERVCAIVRSDLMEKYGFANLETIEDYEDFLKAVKENDKNIVPLDDSSVSIFFTFVNLYGYTDVANFLVMKLDDPEHNVVPWETTPEFGQAYEIMKRWKTEGYMKSVDNFKLKFAMGGLASTISNWNDAQVWVRNLTGNYKFNIYPLNMDTAAPYPRLQPHLVINKESKHVKEVLKFIEWINLNQDNYDMIMNGIKGKNYNIVNDRVELISGQLPYSGWEGSKTLMANKYFRAFTGDPEGFVKTFNNVLIRKAVYNPVNGYEFDWSEYESIFDGRGNLYSTFDQDIKYGNFNMTPDKFTAKQKEFGLDNMMKKTQKQVNDWMKKTK